MPALHRCCTTSWSSTVCSEILNDLEEPTEAEEVRLKIKADDFKPIAAAAIDGFEAWVAATAGWQVDSPNHEGVRARVLDADGAQTGWALVRASLHDPLVVINAESDVAGGALPPPLPVSASTLHRTPLAGRPLPPLLCRHSL